jgi:hypothetical protein
VPRKRRTPKARRLPAGLREISLAERATWSCQGPTLASDVDDQTLAGVWPDWATWAAFYGSVRDELHASRPWLAETSVAEHLFEAWRDGRRDLGERREALIAALRPDPRLNPPWGTSE